MWASTFLTLIFIAAELPLGGTGEQGRCKAPEPMNNTKTPCPDNYSSNSFRMQCKDGFVRKVGTSSLFRCIQMETKEYNWVNSPRLICIPDPKLKPSIASATEKPLCTTTGTTKTSSTASGQTAILTTIRTTTKEANTITLSSSTALQVSENETSVSPQSTPPSNIITTTVVNISAQNLTPSTSSTTEKTWCTTMQETSTSTASEPSGPASISNPATGAITGGIILFILVIGALAGTLLWCQRQKKHCRTPHIKEEAPNPVLPLLDRPTSPSNCLSHLV